MRNPTQADIERMYVALRKARVYLNRAFDDSVLAPARVRRNRQIAARARRALHKAGYPVI